MTSTDISSSAFPDTAQPRCISLARRLLTWILLAGVFFVAIAPTLDWMDFANTLENLNVATALEIHRTGNWMEPTLEGEWRTKKPPLVAWITAAAIRSSTLSHITSLDADIRNRGFSSLAWDVRWPALLAACLSLIAIYELARVLIGYEWLSISAAMMAGGTWFFLKYARGAALDVYLMLFVAIADVFLARAIFRRQWWRGCIGAGVAAGVAFMCKGPVSLLQCLAPFLVLIVVAAWIQRRAAAHKRAAHNEPLFPTPAIKSRWLLPTICGILAWAIVALPWYLIVLAHHPNKQWGIWFKEVTGEDAPLHTDSPAVYLRFVPYLFPWIIYMIAGVVALKSRRNWRLLAAILLIVVPITVMLFFKERKDRYLLPMLGPAAILSAYGICVAYQIVLLRRLHWLLMAGMAIALPTTGLLLRGMDGTPWYTPVFAAGCCASLLAIVAIGFLLTRPGSQSTGVYEHRRSTWPMLVLWTSIAMLLGNVFFQIGYCKSPNGRSELRPLAEEIWQNFPNADIYTVHPQVRKRLATELSIYLNRTDRWMSPASISAMRPADHPILAFVVLPRLAVYTPPNGWILWKQIPRGQDDRWDLLLLPAAIPPPATAAAYGIPHPH